MSKQVGDEDEIGAAGHQSGREGVPQDLGCDVRAETGCVGDTNDDVAGATHGQPAAAVIEEQGRVGVGAGPVRPVIQPAAEVCAQSGMDRDLADPGTVAADAKRAPLTGEGQVARIEANGLGNPGAGCCVSLFLVGPGWDGYRGLGGGATLDPGGASFHEIMERR